MKYDITSYFRLIRHQLSVNSCVNTDHLLSIIKKIHFSKYCHHMIMDGSWRINEIYYEIFTYSSNIKFDMECRALFAELLRLKKPYFVQEDRETIRKCIVESVSSWNINSFTELLSEYDI